MNIIIIIVIIVIIDDIIVGAVNKQGKRCRGWYVLV
jgi:hypothetical protein